MLHTYIDFYLFFFFVLPFNFPVLFFNTSPWWITEDFHGSSIDPLSQIIGQSILQGAPNLQYMLVC